MFSLQPPRHISTLPSTPIVAMQRFRRYRGDKRTRREHRGSGAHEWDVCPFMKMTSRSRRTAQSAFVGFAATPQFPPYCPHIVDSRENGGANEHTLFGGSARSGNLGADGTGFRCAVQGKDHRPHPQPSRGPDLLRRYDHGQGNRPVSQLRSQLRRFQPNNPPVPPGPSDKISRGVLSRLLEGWHLRGAGTKPAGQMEQVPRRGQRHGASGRPPDQFASSLLSGHPGWRAHSCRRKFRQSDWSNPDPSYRLSRPPSRSSAAEPPVGRLFRGRNHPRRHLWCSRSAGDIDGGGAMRRRQQSMDGSLHRCPRCRRSRLIL